MKAIIISSYGGPEVLTVTELPDPVPAADEVLIAVRAFGLNHAEAYMRSGAMGEVAKVTGIECAGTVAADPSGPRRGNRGGRHPRRHGQDSQRQLRRACHRAGQQRGRGQHLAAVDRPRRPARGVRDRVGLRQNLDLHPGQTVLIRGATSALGQAAVNVAAEQGATVIATTAGRTVLPCSSGSAPRPF